MIFFTGPLNPCCATVNIGAGKSVSDRVKNTIALAI